MELQFITVELIFPDTHPGDEALADFIAAPSSWPSMSSGSHHPLLNFGLVRFKWLELDMIRGREINWKRRM